MLLPVHPHYMYFFSDSSLQCDNASFVTAFYYFAEFETTSSTQASGASNSLFSILKVLSDGNSTLNSSISNAHNKAEGETAEAPTAWALSSQIKINETKEGKGEETPALNYRKENCAQGPGRGDEWEVESLGLGNGEEERRDIRRPENSIGEALERCDEIQEEINGDAEVEKYWQIVDSFAMPRTHSRTHLMGTPVGTVARSPLLSPGLHIDACGSLGGGVFHIPLSRVPVKLEGGDSVEYTNTNGGDVGVKSKSGDVDVGEGFFGMGGEIVGTCAAPLDCGDCDEFCEATNRCRCTQYMLICVCV